MKDKAVKKGKKIGLVLSSGGLKAVSILPFYKFLKAYDIHPDLLIGCSGGAISSSLWAAGFSIPQIENYLSEFIFRVQNDKMLSQIDLASLFGISNYLNPSDHRTIGLLKNQKLLEYFHDVWGHRVLEFLPIQNILCTTDLESGKEVFVETGSVAKAVYASCAVYPLLQPIHLHNRCLVDGAYHSSLPILEAIKRGCDTVIAIALTEPTTNKYSGFLNFYLNVISQITLSNSKKQNPMALHMHDGEVFFLNFKFNESIEPWSVGALEHILSIGEKSIETHKDELLRVLKS